MNSKFDALAKLAGVQPNILRTDQIQKFAELIVLECADISFDHWVEHKECSASFSIREHFGVSINK